MKLFGVMPSTYIDFGVINNKKDTTFKVTM